MHVLLAFDDSEPAWTALEYVLEHHADATITVLHVINPSASLYGEYAQIGIDRLVEERSAAAEDLLDRVSDRAAEADVSLEGRVEIGLPDRQIIEVGEELDVDHIVIGSHGRGGVTRVLLGSVAEKVARRSPVPVTIVR